jgi:hypothetical protein
MQTDQRIGEMTRPKRKRRGFYWALLFVLVGIGSHSPVPAGSLPPHLQMAEIRLATPVSQGAKEYLGLPDGNSFELSQIDAKFIVLAYYSRECPFCHEQAPIANRIYESIRQDPVLDQDVKMLGVMIGGSPKETAKYSSTLNIMYPMTYDPFFDIYRKLNKPRVPLTLLTTSSGEILLSFTGAMRDYEEFVKKIRKFHRKE